MASSGWADAPAGDVRVAAVRGSTRGDAASRTRAREAVRAVGVRSEAPPRFSPGSRVGRSTLPLHRSPAPAPLPHQDSSGQARVQHVLPPGRQQPATSRAQSPYTPRSTALGECGDSGDWDPAAATPDSTTGRPLSPVSQDGRGAWRAQAAGPPTSFSPRGLGAVRAVRGTRGATVAGWCSAGVGARPHLQRGAPPSFPPPRTPTPHPASCREWGGRARGRPSEWPAPRPHGARLCPPSLPTPAAAGPSGARAARARSPSLYARPAPRGPTLGTTGRPRGGQAAPVPSPPSSPARCGRRTHEPLARPRAPAGRARVRRSARPPARLSRARRAHSGNARARARKGAARLVAGALRPIGAAFAARRAGGARRAGQAAHERRGHHRRARPSPLPLLPSCYAAGVGGVVLATALAVSSGFGYLRAAWPFLLGKEA